MHDLHEAILYLLRLKQTRLTGSHRAPWNTNVTEVWRGAFGSIIRHLANSMADWIRTIATITSATAKK